MPDIPEFQIDPTAGPVLKLMSPDGSKVHQLDLDNDGDICLDGSKFRHADAQFATLTADASETADAFTDVPGAELTTAGDGSKVYQVAFSGALELSTAKSRVHIQLLADGVLIPGSARDVTSPAAKKRFVMATHGFTQALPAGKVVKLQWRVERLSGNKNPAASVRDGSMTIYGVN